MIIYNVFANNGGMLRVTESMFEIFKYLGEDFPLRVVIFAKKPIATLNPKHFKWITWSDDDSRFFTEEGKAEIVRALKEEYKDTKISLIIGDTFTLKYWEDFDAPFCYDAHYLDKPFYAAFHKCKEIEVLDQFSPNKICRQLNVMELMTYKKEYRYMRRCKFFIANSSTTKRHLETFYSDVTQGKPVEVVPVSTELQASTIKHTQAYQLYYAGRFHPQKGLHYLFNRQNIQAVVHMRGFVQAILTDASMAWLNQRGLVALPWTDDSSVIRAELLAAKAVLFPSIYEPWGLSLQEALGLGKVCIANRNDSGHEEQITDRENGFLVDFNSADAWKEIGEIQSLNGQELKRIGENARQSTHLGHEQRLKKMALVLEKFYSMN